MAAGSLDKIRLFVALDLPKPVLSAVEDFQNTLQQQIGGGDWRFIPVDSMHITLVFLGSQCQEQVPQLRDLLKGLSYELPPLRFSKLLLKPRRAARVLALELEDRSGYQADLQRVLLLSCVNLGVCREDGRPFWPHLTLARRKAVKARPPLKKAALPKELPEPLQRPFSAVGISLYSSDTKQEGVRYRSLVSVEL